MSSGYAKFVSRAEQSAWKHSLQPNTAYVDFVFNNGDGEHPLLEQLAHLESTRTVGVASGNGYYYRPRPAAIRRRFAYDRDIILRGPVLASRLSALQRAALEIEASVRMLQHVSSCEAVRECTECAQPHESFRFPADPE